MSPLILTGQIRYIASAFYCDISLLNLTLLIYFIVRIYLFPLAFMTGIYVIIWRHVRRTKSIVAIRLNAPHRLKNNCRDLVVMRRLLTTMIILSLLWLSRHLSSILLLHHWKSICLSLPFDLDVRLNGLSISLLFS